MDILLHICCGPCLIYPFSLLNKKFSVRGFYYNPNIYPAEEYNRRKQALGVLENEFKFKVEHHDYSQADYLQAIDSAGAKLKPERCQACYDLRIKKTAQYAKANGFKAFSTTLLVSPYQDHERLKVCAVRQANETGLDFYYQDFRPGFRDAQAQAKKMGIYRQKYCGCIFSINKI